MMFYALTGLLMLGIVYFGAIAQAESLPTYAEKYRPQFHFTATLGWINDPNGLVFFNGQYHLCFQRNDALHANGDNMAWGHAVSTDLVHWRQRSDAISPENGDSIWSGSAVVDWHNSSGLGRGDAPPLVAAYTWAKKPFSQCLAYSNDDGRTWTKYADNPVLPHIHALNRDPKVIWHEPSKQWIMALYLDQKGKFALFHSKDLRAWSKLQDVDLDDDECPDFFPLDLDGDPGKTQWIFTAANGHYLVGAFDGQSFRPQTPSLAFEHGPNFYAAQTYSDIPPADGRRIQIGWMRDGQYPGMPFNQQLSFPAVLTLKSTPEGPRIFRWPVKEIESLYKSTLHRQAVRLSATPVLDDVAGELFDLSADIDMESSKSVTLNIRGLPITLQPAGGHLFLSAWDRKVSLPLNGGRIALRVLVDRTSIEIFGNHGETVLSGCFLPTEDEHPLRLTSDAGAATLREFTLHTLKSAWRAGK